MKGMRAATARAGTPCIIIGAMACLALAGQAGRAADRDARPRAREIGIEVGILQTGELNAITDVPGVKVGHRTRIEGDDIRTGVTVIIPHGGNLFEDKVPAAIFVGNGFGKAAGISQVRELGTIETPIALTSTLNVPEVSAALIEYTLGQDGNEEVMSVNPVVGETNDGFLNDIRSRPVAREDVLQAIRDASGGPVEEGSVGAGTGTRCFGFKGGIGTSSRIVESSGDSYTVGVIIQTNFGGLLQINGAPVGRELRMGNRPVRQEAGSCIIVVAMDAPLSSASLERIARRALFAMARTGSSFSNGSGDYAIAFSTGFVRSGRNEDESLHEIRGNDLNPLFLAVLEATEEAIYNSLLKATTVCGRSGHCAEAIPVDEVVRICRYYRVLDLSRRFQTGK
jgi:D-aminopeptidase